MIQKWVISEKGAPLKEGNSVNGTNMSEQKEEPLLKKTATFDDENCEQ